MKVGLLGTGLAMAHAHIFHTHPRVSEVVVFGRTPAKLQAFAEEFGYATTTDLSSIYHDPAIELVDICLPTALHADHVLRALQVTTTPPLVGLGALGPAPPGRRRPHPYWRLPTPRHPGDHPLRRGRAAHRPHHHHHHLRSRRHRPTPRRARHRPGPDRPGRPPPALRPRLPRRHPDPESIAGPRLTALHRHPPSQPPIGGCQRQRLPGGSAGRSPRGSRSAWLPWNRPRTCDVARVLDRESLEVRHASPRHPPAVAA
jgi:hypothetical protein